MKTTKQYYTIWKLKMDSDDYGYLYDKEPLYKSKLAVFARAKKIAKTVKDGRIVVRLIHIDSDICEQWDIK